MRPGCRKPRFTKARDGKTKSKRLGEIGKTILMHRQKYLVKSNRDKPHLVKSACLSAVARRELDVGGRCPAELEARGRSKMMMCKERDLSRQYIILARHSRNMFLFPPPLPRHPCQWMTSRVKVVKLAFENTRACLLHKAISVAMASFTKA
jgi:hypothetical protein